MHLYQPDQNLPGTRILLDVAALWERLARWIELDGAAEISIANIRYKPNTSCLVSYKIQTDQRVSYFHAKAFAADDWQIRKIKLDDKRERVWVDDELSFAAFKFPVDSELADMEAFVSHPDAFLERVLFAQHRGEKFKSFEILAYKPNRRFVARLDFDAGSTLVLKLHDESKFHNVLIAAAALKKSIAVETPIRVGRSHRHRALAYQWIAGAPLDISACRARDIEPLIEQIIEYLDRLHIPMVPSIVNLPCQHAADGLDAIASYLAVICPPLATTAKRISREIIANLTDDDQPTVIHGDFHEGQIIVSKNGIEACDFDNFCINDLTADLANFLAHLRYRASMGEVGLSQVELAQEISVRHYLDQHHRRAANRFVWNQLAALFRLSTHPFRSGSNQWMAETERLLQHLAGQINAAKHATAAKSKFIEASSGPGDRHNIRQRSEDSESAKSIRASIQNDESLTFLSGVFDPAIAAEFLHHHCPNLQTIYGPYTINDVVARRHKPGRRCLVEFCLATHRGPRSVLGKVSAKRLDRKTFETQQALFQQHRFGDTSRDGIRVPRAIGCCPPWKLWIQEKVTAISGSELLNESRLSPYADRIADAIAKLHHSKFGPQQEHTVAHELEILNDRLTDAMSTLPAESQRIEQILQNCVAVAAGIDESLKVAIHRDFYQDQIMFANERTYLVDLDLVKLGHPALDVGNFLAHLTEHGIRRHGDPYHWQHTEREIRSRYLARNPRCHGSEIDAFKAISFARHIFLSCSRPARRKWTLQVIEMAEQLIREMTPKVRVIG